MTDTTITVFKKYQVRKTKKQKRSFAEYVQTVAEKRGYQCKLEKTGFGASNIVVGDPEKAKVVYTAHYDTCARLPFPNFITPKNISIYLLYNILLVLMFFAVSVMIGILIGVVIGVVSAFFPDPFWAVDLAQAIFLIVYFSLLLLMIFGPANKHTANDNTSGVIVLLDLMNEMPDEFKETAAFIFFDMEEAGLFGSMGYASKHKAAMKEKLLVNFDCVSDGENILIVPRKKAAGYAESLSRAYVSNDSVSVEVATKGVFYPSDQASFPCGVGVAALKRTKKRGILYMDRIHAKKDVIYREENIDFLVKGSLKLTEIMSEE